MKAIFFFLSIWMATLGAALQPLRIGMELNYPPFEMVCPNGQPCGISVDMGQALGLFLHREVCIENIAFSGMIPSLNSGKVDLIISSLTITEQREKAIDFSIPYAETGLCLLVSVKSDLESIKEANQIGRVIVVKLGTSGEIYAMRNLNNATVRVLDKESMCVLEVVQGKADAFIYDQLSVYTNWQKNLGTTRAILMPFQKEEWAIGIRKGNQILLDQVNRFIRQFKEEGGLDQLADKYLPEQKAAFQKLGVPFVF
ncbi:MAG: transporter substrate-binding domain-containing protein [Chlamydiales bacterium]